MPRRNSRERDALLREMSRMGKIGRLEIRPCDPKSTWTDEVAAIFERGPEDRHKLLNPDVEFGIGLFEGESRPLIESAVTEIIEHGTPYDLELKIVTPKGNHKWVRTIGQPVKHGNRVTQVKGILQDITDRKRAEEEIQKLNVELEDRVRQRTSALEEANKELETFSYSVSHDLRAPLRAISGFSQILIEDHQSALNEEGRHYLDNIVRAGAEMDRLITDLLEYSRLGRKAVILQPVPLEPVVDQVLRGLTDFLNNTGGTLTISRDLPSVLGDRTLLHQIFSNILANALTYHREGVPPEVTINHEIKGTTVLIRVVDNGIGIEPEFQEKIFNIFQRLHSQDDSPVRESGSP